MRVRVDYPLDKVFRFSLFSVFWRVIQVFSEKREDDNRYNKPHGRNRFAIDAPRQKNAVCLYSGPECNSIDADAIDP